MIVLFASLEYFSKIPMIFLIFSYYLIKRASYITTFLANYITVLMTLFSKYKYNVAALILNSLIS